MGVPRVIHKTSAKPGQKWWGNGMQLGEVETLLKAGLDSSDAEIRFAARQIPVLVKLNFQQWELVITDIRMSKQGLVITIDPKF